MLKGHCCLAKMSHGKRNPPTTDSMLPWGPLMPQKRELVGCYILLRLTKNYRNNIGLYRDDRLSFNKTPQEIERIKKDIRKIFRDNDLKITVEANLASVFRRHSRLKKWQPLHIHQRRKRTTVRTQAIEPPTFNPWKYPRIHI